MTVHTQDVHQSAQSLDHASTSVKQPPEPKWLAIEGGGGKPIRPDPFNAKGAFIPKRKGWEAVLIAATEIGFDVYRRGDTVVLLRPANGRARRGVA